MSVDPLIQKLQAATAARSQPSSREWRRAWTEQWEYGDVEGDALAHFAAENVNAAIDYLADWETWDALHLALRELPVGSEAFDKLMELANRLEEFLPPREP